MTRSFDLTHDLLLKFSRPNLGVAVFQEWVGPDLFETLAEMDNEIIVKL